MAVRRPGRWPYTVTGMSSWAYPGGRGNLPAPAAGGGGGGGADPWTKTLTQVQGLINSLKHPNVAKDPTLLAWSAERSALARETAAEAVRRTKEANRAGNYALALTRLNQQNEGDVAQQYRNAASQIQGFGEGLTGTVQAAQQQGADQTAAAVNAVTGGRAPLGGIAGFDPTALANVSQVTGATIPATSFSEESARAALDAAMRTKAAGWNVLGIESDFRQKAIDARVAAGLEMKKLIAQKPVIVAKIMAQNRTDRLTAEKLFAQIVNQRQTALNQQASTKAYADWLATQGVAKTAETTGVSPTGGDTPEVQKIKNDYKVNLAKARGNTAKQKQATIDAHQKLATYHTKANGYLSDWQGKPIDRQGNPIPPGQPLVPAAGFTLDPQGNPIKQYSPGTTAAGKPPKYSDVTKLQSTMSSAIRAKLQLDNPFLANKAILALPIWTKARIASWLMSNYGSSFLTTYPGQQKAVQRMANDTAASIYADLLTRKRAALGR